MIVKKLTWNTTQVDLTSPKRIVKGRILFLKRKWNDGQALDIGKKLSEHLYVKQKEKHQSPVQRQSKRRLNLDNYGWIKNNKISQGLNCLMEYRI